MEEEMNQNTDMSTSVVVEEYFKSYEDFDVHRIMLQDKVRTEAYMNAIFNAKEDVFRGKVVMDVGAGTGILSLFCAKAGAKKVFAVEKSGLAKMLPKVVEDNGFNDVIEVIHSKVEDIAEPLQVDVIVSEWMGFYLLHESMLDSVVIARDKFLKTNGVMFPSIAQIFAAPCAVPEQWNNYSEFWKERQYGFNLSAFSSVAKIKDKPEIALVPATSLKSDPQLLWSLDLKTVDLDRLQQFKDRRFFAVEEEGDAHAVCIWFVCEFPTLNEDGDHLSLSTAPWDPETHWKQTVLILPNHLTLEEGDIMGWEFNMEKMVSEDPINNTSRSYRIHFELLDAASEEHPVPCHCGTVKCELVRHFMDTHPSNEDAESIETVNNFETNPQ